MLASFGLFAIDNQSRKAVYEQIVEQTERFVLTGILGADAPMPSVRSLSVELSVNLNTIQKAYSELERRGVIYITPGRGSFVSPKALEALAAGRMKHIESVETLARECMWAGIDKQLVIEAVEKGYDPQTNGGNL